MSKLYSVKRCIPTVPKCPITVCIPFIGPLGVDLRKRILSIVRKRYPQVSLRFVFRISTRVRNVFSFKDRVPESCLSGVVYRFSCGGCNSSYYGKTKRHLTIRIHEHLGRSFYTGKVLSCPSFSAVRDHAASTGHMFSASNFSVISRSSSDVELTVREALLIHKDRPVLNTLGVQLSSDISLFV